MSVHDLQKSLNKAVKDVRSLGYEVGVISEIFISTRYTRAWGKCYRKGNTFRIGVGLNLLRMPDKAIRDTIYHEVLHCVPGCFNHGHKWKFIASQCDKKFGTRIARVTSEEEKMTRR